jgi:nickel-dependent lactate racemase
VNPSKVKIDVPYGETIEQVEAPEGTEVIYPNRVPVADENEILQQAITNPVGIESLEDFLSRPNNILAIVNDATRATPTAKILKCIYNFIRNKKTRFLVATGAHKTPTETGYHKIFGEFWDRCKNRVHTHDAKRDEQMAYLGETRRGNQVHLNKMVIEAQAILVIGSVEPHYFAGYTGGRKSFLPGIASYDAIEKNHELALNKDARVLRLEGNPIHEDMIDAIDLLGERRIFSIMTVLDKDHRIYAASAGSLEDSFIRAVAKADDVYSVNIRDRADIAVSVAFSPMDVDLYQSQKAIEHAKGAVNEDGITILVAKCWGGIGPKHLETLLNNLETADDFKALARAEYKLGYHRIVRTVEFTNKGQIWGVTGISDHILKKLLIKPFHHIQDALDEALLEKGKDAKVVFLMDGTVTVPRLTY